MKIAKRLTFGSARETPFPGPENLNFNGDSGDNVFTGGVENDTAVGNGGNDTLSGGDGQDLLVGNSGADTLNGGNGDDRLFGGDESPPFSYPYYGNQFTPPLLDTGSEVDDLSGDAGDDVIFAGYGDNADGGTNNVFGDLLQISFLGASSGVTFDFSLATQVIGGGTITGFENIGYAQGSNFDDDINAVGGSNGYSPFGAVYGMGGNDRLRAGYYTGTLFGGDGNDIVDGRGSQYLQMVDGGEGDDTLYTNSNTFATAYGGGGNDTIYSHGTTYGGAGNDLIVLQFSYYGGVVYGEDGNDEIRASGTGNSISGGAGADILTGDAGIDTLVAGGFLPNGTVPDYDMALDHDVLAGFGSNDILSAGYRDDIDGGSGSDTLRYSLGGLASGIAFDTTGFVSGQPFAVGGGTINSVETLSHLRGTNFADMLTLATQAQLLTVDAADGDDIATSNGSSVALNGGNGNDRLISGIAGDVFDGGAGTDTIDYRNYAAGVTVSLGLTAGQTGTGAGGDSLLNVENIDGSASGDTLAGSNDANVILGMAGVDSLDGKGGSDSLDGGLGADLMTGGLGDDSFFIDDAGDQLFESSNQGNDIAYAGISYTLAAGQHVETLVLAETGAALGLTGNELANILIGNGANNALNGGSGNDTLIGGAGQDVMAGGDGNDIYNVDDVGDQVAEAGGGGADLIYTSVGYTLAPGAEVETLSAASLGSTTPLVLTGNEFAQVIYGNAGANLLNGGGGADVLIGLGGNDTYFVDNVADRTVENGGEGTDIVYANLSYQLEAGASIEILSPDSLGATTALTFVGNALVQLIYGNAGANVLTGGGGADQLVGLGGDDTYLITQGSEAVFEAAGGGTDIVYTQVSHALAGGQEIELLSTASNAATTALDLTGNEYANTIYGNDGINNLRGGGGDGDKLVGLGGNDVYFIQSGTEQLFEAAGGGSDVVYTNLSHALVSGQEIEILSAISNAATTAMDLTGNELANVIYANDGVNNLRGGGGADVMVGYGGNDVYYIVSGTESVIEANGGGSDVVYTNLSYALGAGQEIEVLLAVSQGATTAMDLTGNAIANQLYGNNGANTLNGGAGADFMLGYGGADTFQFTTALGGGNVDTIGDFNAVDDTIHLDDAVFAGIGGPGALSANAFVTGSQAGDADDRIIYNSATGALLFDADGSGGTAAVQFATLATGLTLTASDFVVI